MSKMIKFITERQWMTLAITMFVIVMSSLGMKNLELHSSYRDFFDDSNQQLADFDAIQSSYTDLDTILIAVSGNGRDVYNQETMKAVGDITDLAWQVPYSIRVDSITNYQHTTVYGDDLIVDNLVDIQNMTTSSLVGVNNIANSDPLIMDRLVSENGSTTAIIVTLSLPGESIDEIPSVAQAVRSIKQDIESNYPAIKVHLTGTVMLNAALSEVARADIKYLLPVMICAILGLLYLLLRSASAVITSLLVILFSVTTGMGIFGWLGGNLTSASLSAPIIVLGIAVADSVHILACYLKNLSVGTKTQSMRDSLGSNMRPVFITTLTTVIGFLAMNSSEVPPFRDLGNLVALGVFSAFVISITLLPSLMLILPHKGAKKRSNTVSLNVISDFVVERRGVFFWGGLAVTIALVSLIPNNRLNDHFIGFFQESVEFRQDTDFVSDNLTGIYTFEYSFQSGIPGGVNEPKFLADIEQFKEWVSTQPEVVHVNSITDIYKKLNKNMNANSEQFYRLPDSRELASQYLLLYEMSLPYGLTLDNVLNTDKSSTKVTVTLENISSEHSLELEKRIGAWVSLNMDSIESYVASSPNIMFSHAGYLNAKSMILGTLLGVFFITVVMCIALKSLYYGLLSAVMNLLPIGAAFGLWAIIDGNIGMSLTTAVGMSLGIVVDDSVHLLCKFKEARNKHKLSHYDSVRYAYDRVGPALVITSFVLIVGFIILGCSTFGINADRGIFVSITVTFALIALYTNAPRLLIKDNVVRDRIYRREVIA